MRMNYSPRHKGWKVAALLTALFSCICAPASGAGQPDLAAPSAAQQQYSSAKGNEAGIRIVSLALTANDHLVDMRYGVTDLGKARKFFNRRNRIYLLDETSGAKLAIARIGNVGVLRDFPSSDAKRGYVMVFNNFSKSVRRGDKVTLVINDLRIEGIIVK
jgi:hypothetical protein